MKVLLTGAFGNIGTSALPELVAQGHTVRCLDVPTAVNKRKAARLAQQTEVVWGDLRRHDDAVAALRGQDAVVHLAFVIPRLSATGINSEDQPEFARDVNVGGTLNLLAAMKACPRPPHLLFTSSLHVYGRTSHLPPPRTVVDPVQPVEHYARQKVICEEMIKASGLDWTIFRLGASMPIRLILDPGVFDVPLANRMEYVHSRDVATAIANALRSDRVQGKTWLIGGGPRCQYTYREIAERVLDAFGVGMLPDEAFTTVPFSTDWLDTGESQRVLQFQQRTLQDYVNDVRSALGAKRSVVQLLRPVIRRRLLAVSPYYHQQQIDQLAQALAVQRSAN
ncbi:MAG: NAD(P)-dependent oxidoreductase [Anaerolineae bacterium]|nr:NAD(P)-dependent oxidoreductase [Anaerolineae bacterium]